MKHRILFNLTIVLTWTTAGVALANNTAHLDRIDATLSPEIKSQIKDYDRHLLMAREGDRFSEILLAYKLRARSPESAMLITEALIETHGVVLDDATRIEQDLFYTLKEQRAMLLIDPSHQQFDPERAFYISTQSDLAGDQPTPMTSTLIHAATWLPDSHDLWEAWHAWSDDGKTYENLEAWHDRSADAYDWPEEESSHPDRSGYSHCPSAFSESRAVFAAHQRLQSMYLQDGLIDEQEIRQYDEAMAALEGYRNAMADFRFSFFSANGFLSMLLDMNADTRPSGGQMNLADRIERRTMFLHAKDLNVQVALGMLLEQMNLTFYCRDDDLMVDLVSDEATESPVFIGGLLIEKTPLEQDQTLLRWRDGKTYHGAVQGDIPFGQGVLKVKIDTSDVLTYRGQFKGAQLSGSVLIDTSEGRYRYEGEMVDGELHGTGHLFDPFKGFDFEGRFVRGAFMSDGDRYFYDEFHPDAFKGVDYPEGTIRFRGPIHDDLAHGQGQCTKGNITYPCTFYRNELVGIDSISLIPGVESLPEFD